ncbi:MAG: DUF559 domain-containing protein [Eggerthellaceae bacterium]|nr:DUF559 domain-containing protein [Eggerthellaceae bacterium]
MRICLSDDTAHLVWRNFDNRIEGQPIFGHTPNSGPTDPRAFASNQLVATSNLKQFDTDLTLLETRSLKYLGISENDVVHLLVDRAKRSRTNHRVITHSVSTNPPSKAFLELRPGIFITSPEYHFLRQADNLDLISLVLLGYELTGCYAIRPDLDGGILQRPPLCSKESLSAVIRSTQGQRGSAKAQKALAFIEPGSASPRETGLAMMLSLPVKMGGYGLPKPLLNKRIDLGKDAKPYWSERNAFDLVWPKEKLIVEYDGKCHSEHDLRSRDSLRRDASLLAGYSVFVITNNRLETTDDVRVVAKAVAKKLSKQLRLRSKDFEYKNKELWRRVIRGRYI